MKFRKLSILMGLVAVAGFSSQSMALTPSDTPDVVVNISGASAQQKTLGALVTFFCRRDGSGNPVDLDEYRDKPTTGDVGKAWRSYYCTFDADTADPAVASLFPAALDDKKVLVNNRSAGGSIWGVVPVAREWAVEYINIFEGTNCTDTGSRYECTWDADRATGLIAFTSGNKGFECPFETYVPDDGPANDGVDPETYVATTSGDILVHDGTTAESTVCLKSDGGVSDVEPALFVGNNFPGFTGGTLSPAEQASLTVLSEYAVIFGVSITDNAFKYLQHIQGLVDYDAEGSAGDNNGTIDDAEIQGSDVVLTGEDDRPSMTKTSIQSMLSGQIQSFQQLDQDIVSPTAWNDDFMYVCRRVIGSGTQAAQNAFFMGDPCLGGSSLTMVSSPGAPSFIGNQAVENNSGSGDVIQCQNDATAGTLALAQEGRCRPCD